MKFSKIFLSLLLTTAFGMSVFAQKKAIDEAAYSKWNRVDTYSLSEDGRHVTYKYSSINDGAYRNGGETYYIFDNLTKKTITLDSVSNLNFRSNGQWLSYNKTIEGKSMKMLMRMGDKKILEWTKNDSPNFESDKEPIVSYSSGNDLVILNLNSNDSLVIKGVKRANFYENATMMIYLKIGEKSNDIYYGKVGKNAKHTLLVSDVTKTLSGFNFNSKTKRGSFQVAEKEGLKDDCNMHYNFDLNSKEVSLIFNSSDVKVEPNLFINKSSLTRNNKGRFLTFEVYTFDSSKRNPNVKDKDKPKKDDSFDLELWSWNDPVSQNIQAIRGYREPKAMPYLYAYDMETKRSYPLIKTPYSSLFNSPSEEMNYMFYSDESPYIGSRDWEHDSYSDFYLVNLTNGETKMFKQKMSDRAKWSPSGDYIIYFDSDAKAWMSLEPKTYTFKRISDDIPYAVHNESYDKPNSVPSYGIAAWAKDGNTVLLNDECDIWAIDITGKSKTYCYTRNYGREKGYSLRLFNPGYSDLTVDLTKAHDLEMFNLATMDNGVGTLLPNGKITKNIEGPFSVKVNKNSQKGDTYLYFKQSFSNNRDLWISDSKFKKEYKITDANPQQKDYKWGNVEIVEWTNYEGKLNKGLLYLPEDYQKGKSYPAIVNFYETHTGDKNVYYAPSYSSAMLDVVTYVSNGYIVFMPDVNFTIGEPGKSSYNSVVSGTKALIERGILDANRIGLQGHSWSGYQTAYLITKTNMFKCVNVGAPIVNMTSAYNGIREGSGMPRMFMYEDWQCRMGTTMWEALDKYIESSPVLYADKIKTPVLLFHCDKDEAVSFYEGRSLFLALRRLQQPAWLLNYKGEGHFVNKLEAKRDWTFRMRQFFDYYLNDTEMPRWMSEGININERGFDQKLDFVQQ